MGQILIYGDGTSDDDMVFYIICHATIVAKIGNIETVAAAGNSQVFFPIGIIASSAKGKKVFFCAKIYNVNIGMSKRKFNRRHL